MAIFCTPSVPFIGTRRALVASIAKVVGVVIKIFLGALPPDPLRPSLLLFSPLNRNHAPWSLQQACVAWFKGLCAQECESNRHQGLFSNI